MSAEASNRTPLEAMPAHPQSASADAADVSPRNTARREAAEPIGGTWEWITRGPAKM
jgi:hypothetical protein